MVKVAVMVVLVSCIAVALFATRYAERDEPVAAADLESMVAPQRSVIAVPAARQETVFQKTRHAVAMAGAATYSELAGLIAGGHSDLDHDNQRIYLQRMMELDPEATLTLLEKELSLA